MIFAAVDIGTNSCRLKIAKIEEGKLIVLGQELETTRLGKGFYENRKLQADALERTINCLSRYKQIMYRYEVGVYRIVATSAVREAENGIAFIELLAEKLNLKADLINGYEEADLSYLGVKKGLNLSDGIIVVDLGGGSTEFIWLGEQGGICIHSLPLGVIRVYELGTSRAEIVETLEPLKPFATELMKNPWVFVGGTATTLAAMSQQLTIYNLAAVHGFSLDVQEVERLWVMLNGLTVDERKTLPGLQSERADIIPAGAGIIHVLMKYFNKEKIIISESDIMDGIIWKLAQTGAGNKLI